MPPGSIFLAPVATFSSTSASTSKRVELSLTLDPCDNCHLRHARALWKFTTDELHSEHATSSRFVFRVASCDAKVKFAVALRLCLSVHDCRAARSACLIGSVEERDGGPPLKMLRF
ncbi:hypothetical protein OH76DRAFT_1408009 [Lentinus brumalis]|uniref:Uncharacterized protein n=1 Tax=Lentinus brumalis TaxID=2498619 RepID=A0A371CYT9_9APHY|nr:hypothetical protein OH76DRAFT_1408009 [Polyporus brumalis]